LHITFAATTPLLLPLEKDAAEAAMNKLILCGWSRKPTREAAQWSDNNHSLPQIQFSHINKRSACPRHVASRGRCCCCYVQCPTFSTAVAAIRFIKVPATASVLLSVCQDRLSSRSSAAIFAKPLLAVGVLFQSVILLSWY